MRYHVLLFVALASQIASAQSTAGATISGVVHDSIAQKPLAGAVVQIVSGENTARFASTTPADSLGRFMITGVPTGRYTLGFFHPLLDSIGVEPTLREVFVNNARPIRADLAVPSPARLRTTICGERTSAGGALVVGTIRDARDGAPAAGASVTAEWLELSFTSRGVERKTPRVVVTTAENGWFAMCGVPSGGSVRLVASRGADSTDFIQTEVPASGFIRRELALGPSRTYVVTDTMRRGDSTFAQTRKLRAGDGSLSGSVTAEASGLPLAGAIVAMADGPQTRANDRGEWTLRNVPAGTRMLEVRAVGRYPQRFAVDVVTGAPPLRMKLPLLKTVLDTMKVVASRTNREIRSFDERRRSGAGKYYTSEDLLRRKLITVSDLFRMVPGMRLESDGMGGRVILMRADFGGLCTPRIFVNGMPIFSADALDIDSWVEPEDVGGIEIYTGAFAPAEYQEGLSMNPCGVVLIWRK